MNETVEERILDNGYEDVMIFANNEYDTAFIGMTHDDRAVYDYDLMVKWLMDHDGITDEEAIEWIEYNTIRALSYYPNSPVVIYRM